MRMYDKVLHKFLSSVNQSVINRLIEFIPLVLVPYMTRPINDGSVDVQSDKRSLVSPVAIEWPPQATRM